MTKHNKIFRISLTTNNADSNLQQKDERCYCGRGIVTGQKFKNRNRPTVEVKRKIRSIYKNLI